MSPDASASRPLEVELKYRASGTAAGERLLASDDLAGFHAAAPAETVNHEDRYVDTADGLLAAAGYAGRLRATGRGTVITLKGLRRLDEGGVTHRREELEGPADDAAPAEDWPESAARDAVISICGDAPLVDRVLLRQVRRKRLYGRDAATVELSSDDVEVVDGDGTVVERFAEVELELRSGEESALDPLVDLLAEVEELVPADTSKLERALEAVAQAGAPRVSNAAEASVAAADGASIARADSPAPRLVIPKSPGVLADDPLAEAGRKVLRFHLARMLSREEGTRTGVDAEELHAMRVATRRQRAAWRVFGDAFDDKHTLRHRRRLRDVARDLGAVRDLDVLIEAAVAYQSGLAGHAPDDVAGFEPLVAHWRGQRDVARVVLLKELDSRKYRRWVDAYVGFVETQGAGARPVGPVEPHHVRDTMTSRIWAAYEGCRAYEPVMRWADVTTLHDLRIAAKWLRYTLEFVREALGRDAGPVIEKVVALQDHLGWLHDADVAAALARQFLVEHADNLSPAQAAAIGRYLADREHELARLRRTVGPAWRGISSLAFRRALGRLVAGL